MTTRLQSDLRAIYHVSLNWDRVQDDVLQTIRAEGLRGPTTNAEQVEALRRATYRLIDAANNIMRGSEGDEVAVIPAPGSDNAGIVARVSGPKGMGNAEKARLKRLAERCYDEACNRTDDWLRLD